MGYHNLYQVLCKCTTDPDQDWFAKQSNSHMTWVSFMVLQVLFVTTPMMYDCGKRIIALLHFYVGVEATNLSIIIIIIVNKRMGLAGQTNQVLTLDLCPSFMPKINAGNRTWGRVYKMRVHYYIIMYLTRQQVYTVLQACNSHASNSQYSV